jgi:hypothetical protein
MGHPKDTAIRRTGPSAPLRWLINAGYMPGPAAHMREGFDVLDYGCVHGADVEHLRSLGYSAFGYDPYWHPHRDHQRLYDVVLCTYVLNVILDDGERAAALYALRQWIKPGGVAFVTVRRDIATPTATQTPVFLDFPAIHDGTDFATYRVKHADDDKVAR